MGDRTGFGRKRGACPLVQRNLGKTGGGGVNAPSLDVLVVAPADGLLPGVVKSCTHEEIPR